MSIIGALPVALANGTTADASQVMADLNFIVNAVNAGAQPAGSYSTAGTLDAPSGTRMSFQQAAAPTGWVIDTTITNHTCLYVASGGAIITGSAGYSSFVAGSWNVSAHALTASEIPSHTHGVALATGQYNSGGGSGFLTNATSSAPFNVTTDGGTGGGQGHVHSVTTSWNYITMCIAQKS
ncbi:hypothetical protein [Paraburkholderia sp. D1E]|uniref:hypothetical protein n=1 Tax=Paraburkholderia sp. D1E TaxID=3461398 RepID=UPI0040461B6E